MYLHKEGKVAEYTATERGTSGQYYDLTARLNGNDVWFSNQEYCENGVEFPNWYGTKEEALQAAMDYHETEGCALYLELYPAPEKGDYAFIAQDMDGEWCGFHEKPYLQNTTWADEAYTYDVIKKSPPNPFWRKTLR